jgi:hypothetical protein
MVAPSPSYLSAMVLAIAVVEVFRVWKAWGIEATTTREVSVGAAQRDVGVETGGRHGVRGRVTPH